MTKREQILQAIKTILDGLTTVPASRVFRSRTDAFLRSEAPAILLTWVTDVPNEEVIDDINWRMQVRVGILADGDIPDGQADAVMEEVHAAIMSDPTIGGLALDVIPGPTDFQLLNADNNAGVITAQFVLFYRSNLQTLT